MAWLLDTNVLSELRKPKPAPRVKAFVTEQPLNRLFVSTVSLAELRFGIEIVRDQEKRIGLNDWLNHSVRPMFHQRVLEITEDVMVQWRLLVDEGRRVNHTFSQPDLIIAATAVHHGMTVVTRDRKHFDRARVPVCNPWLDG